MTELDGYLAKFYWNDLQLTTAASISIEEFDALIGKRLVSAPTYVVTECRKVGSFVFGQMEAPGSTPGRYFHPN